MTSGLRSLAGLPRGVSESATIRSIIAVPVPVNDAFAKREAAVAADEARVKALADKASSDADAAATLKADLERRAAAVQEALK